MLELELISSEIIDDEFNNIEWTRCEVEYRIGKHTSIVAFDFINIGNVDDIIIDEMVEQEYLKMVKKIRPWWYKQW